MLKKTDDIKDKISKNDMWYFGECILIKKKYLISFINRILKNNK